MPDEMTKMHKRSCGGPYHPRLAVSPMPGLRRHSPLTIRCPPGIRKRLFKLTAFRVCCFTGVCWHLQEAPSTAFFIKMQREMPQNNFVVAQLSWTLISTQPCLRPAQASHADSVFDTFPFRRASGPFLGAFCSTAAPCGCLRCFGPGAALFRMPELGMARIVVSAVVISWI